MLFVVLCLFIALPVEASHKGSWESIKNNLKFQQQVVQNTLHGIDCQKQVIDFTLPNSDPAWAYTLSYNKQLLDCQSQALYMASEQLAGNIEVINRMQAAKYKKNQACKQRQQRKLLRLSTLLPCLTLNSPSCNIANSSDSSTSTPTLMSSSVVTTNSSGSSIISREMDDNSLSDHLLQEKEFDLPSQHQEAMYPFVHVGRNAQMITLQQDKASRVLRSQAAKTAQIYQAQHQEKIKQQKKLQEHCNNQQRALQSLHDKGSWAVKEQIKQEEKNVARQDQLERRKAQSQRDKALYQQKQDEREHVRVQDLLHALQNSIEEKLRSLHKDDTVDAISGEFSTLVIENMKQYGGIKDSDAAEVFARRVIVHPLVVGMQKDFGDVIKSYPKFNKKKIIQDIIEPSSKGRLQLFAEINASYNVNFTDEQLQYLVAVDKCIALASLAVQYKK